jgi:DNA repair protein RadD
MTKFNLRYYQKDAIEICYTFLKSKSTRKSLAVLPCAAGKSIVIAELANMLDDSPVLVLQPTVELLKQNYSKLLSIGGEAEIYSASTGLRNIGHLTYATIKSIKNDYQKFKDLGLKYVLIDEAHYHTKAKSEISKFLKKVGVKNVLGFTATPLATKSTLVDGSCLVMQNRDSKNFFNDIIFVTQIKELVDNNWWSPLEYRQVDIDDSMLSLNSTGADFNEYSIQKFYNENEIEGQIIATLKQLLDDGYKSILVSVPTIENVQYLHSQFRRESTYLYSGISTIERNKNIKSFDSGKVPIMFQVKILTTGYDRPDLEVVLDANPTNSFSVYYQLLGRVVRINSGKEKGLIIDLSGNYGRFGKLDNVVFEDLPNHGWAMLSNEVLMTSVPMKTPIHERPNRKDIIKILADSQRVEQTIPKGLMPYGKHKGKAIKDIPVSYLIWVYTDWTFNKQTLWIKKEIEKVVDFEKELK